MDVTVSTATRKGDRPTNQDHAIVVDGALAVLDGATSWLPQDPDQDGGWYARTLGAELTLLLPGHDRSLADLLAEAIATIRDRHRLDPVHSPTSTVSILRWDDETLETLVLADSPVVVYPRSGDPDVVHDSRLDAVAAHQRRAYREHLRTGRRYGTSFEQLLVALQTEEGAWRNRDGGFWVAGAIPDAARHALVRRWDVGNIARGVALTDGAAAGVTDYGTDDWGTLGKALAAAGPSAVVDAVHSLEAGDPDGLAWPRSKRHDDKTIALVQFAT